MAEIYTNNLHKHFKVLFANFPPGTPLRLGDYGEMNGKIFVRRGNIADDFGVSFEVREDQAKDDYEYKSGNSIQVAFNAKGSGTVGGVVNVKAGLNINFAKENSIFFYAADCGYNSIKNQVALGRDIMKLFTEKKWNQNHVLITNLLSAGATTIIISGSKSASIALEAKSDQIEVIELADASIGLSLKSEKNVAFKQITKEGLQPLIGLMKVQSKGLFNKTFDFDPFESIASVMPSLSEIEKMSIEPDEAFYFGQFFDLSGETRQAEDSEPTLEVESALPPVSGYFGDLGRSANDEGIEEDVKLPSEVKAKDEDLDIAFWNIEWFNKNVENKIRGVARFIADMKLDVWALEETSPQATEKLVKLLNEAYGLDFAFDSSEPNAPNAKQSTTVMWNRETVEGVKDKWLPEIETVLRLTSKEDLTPLEDLESAEEAVHGKIFDRYPGLFRFQSRRNADLNFYLVPLHLKAMPEGSLRRQLACRVLSAAIKKMNSEGADSDWILGGDVNAPLSSGDFNALTENGLTAISAQDESGGAISYIKSPHKSMIDHIFLSKNLIQKFGSNIFTVVAANEEIPNFIKTISDHRPVMMRLHVGEDLEESVSALPSFPQWFADLFPKNN